MSRMSPQQLISDWTEHVTMCNSRKWLRGRGSCDVKKTALPARRPYPHVPAHTQTGLELGWGFVTFGATDGKVGDRETD